jgi:hypothetical protein
MDYSKIICPDNGGKPQEFLGALSACNSMLALLLEKPSGLSIYNLIHLFHSHPDKLRMKRGKSSRNFSKIPGNFNSSSMRGPLPGMVLHMTR